MCSHKFCSCVKLEIAKKNISSKKIFIWIYSRTRKNTYICFIKERFREYDPLSGSLQPQDECCYQKFLIRVMNKFHLIVNYQTFENIFSVKPRVYGTSLVFIGKYENIPRTIIKNKIKKEDGLYEDFELFNLCGEEFSKFNRKRNTLTFLSKYILDKSLEENWLNI